MLRYGTQSKIDKRRQQVRESFKQYLPQVDAVVQSLIDEAVLYVRIPSWVKAHYSELLSAEPHLLKFIQHEVAWRRSAMKKEAKRLGYLPTLTELSKSIDVSRCRVCGNCVASHEAVVTVATPAKRGGKYEDGNFIVVCGECLNYRGLMALDEWKAYRAQRSAQKTYN